MIQWCSPNQRDRIEIEIFEIRVLCTCKPFADPSPGRTTNNIPVDRLQILLLLKLEIERSIFKSEHSSHRLDSTILQDQALST